MIYRIDVRTSTLEARGDNAGVDPFGEALRRQIEEFSAGDVGPIRTRRIFLIDTEADPASMQRVADELLADPIVERAEVSGNGNEDKSASRIEVHLKPGVMDPVASSTEMAIRDMGLPVREVRTGRAFLFEKALPEAELSKIASHVLANGVIESVHFQPFVPSEFARGYDYQFQLRLVPLRELSDEQLVKLSREAHLFLSPAEMKAIRSYYREQGREPTDIELEMIAQTWSEHCVHKTLKSAVDVEVRDAGGRALETRHYGNLIKETIFASTMRLMQDRPGFCLSVFADNAGVIAFDEIDAVCFKVETHNHPSAIEPYGGSATGIGGVIRDVLGTGLAARPVANTDVFCVAFPERDREERREDAGTRRRGEIAPSNLAASPSPRVSASPLPKGIIHPKRILRQVVAGVRDYGNRMGIPTVNGAVYFDDRYLGNPLVFCGCVGILPRDKIAKAAQFGDAVVVMGGRTGRDGIHGATFSSAELTDTHADEFSHAVQIGNAITEKKMADVILAARDRGLFTAVTDCGAGGLSSAVGEMGEQFGASVDLEKVPLKYAGLRYDEIWISEAQERMVLSVPPDRLEALLRLAADEDVETTVIGTFGTPNRQIILRYQGTEVGRLSMEFLHHGIPMPTRKAVVSATRAADAPPVAPKPIAGVKEHLLALLAHPNIASKHWVIRQYDHEVQGGSAIKPLVGPLQMGPSDAAVVRPKLGSHRGVVLGCGLAPHVQDPYEMALWAIDEAVRNVVAVGADPAQVAILDNFCWPSVDDEQTMGTLVRACEACRDAALAYGIPFISGKDSLHNQFTNQETGEVLRIPNTLLISAIGVVDDVRRCVTMDLKADKDALLLVEPSAGPSATPAQRAAVHRGLARAIAARSVVAAHDCSEGGLAVALAEMCIGSGLGAILIKDLDDAAFFEEFPARYIVETTPAEEARERFDALVGEGLKVTYLGDVSDTRELILARRHIIIPIDAMRNAWRGTLHW